MGVGHGHALCHLSLIGDQHLKGPLLRQIVDAAVLHVSLLQDIRGNLHLIAELRRRKRDVLDFRGLMFTDNRLIDLRLGHHYRGKSHVLQFAQQQLSPHFVDTFREGHALLAQQCLLQLFRGNQLSVFEILRIHLHQARQHFVVGYGEPHLREGVGGRAILDHLVNQLREVDTHRIAWQLAVGDQSVDGGLGLRSSDGGAANFRQHVV